MGVMALFHLQKMFSFQYFFKKDWCIEFIFYTQVNNHKNKGQVWTRVKSANYESYGPFFNFIFCKMLACRWGWPLGGGMCHIDTFLILFILQWLKVPLINANSVDPDQMLHFTASDLGQLCLPITLLWVCQLKWLVFNLNHSMNKFIRWQIDIFLIFPRKWDLTFDANCPQMSNPVFFGG